jgi:archaellum component FlaC
MGDWDEMKMEAMNDRAGEDNNDGRTEMRNEVLTLIDDEITKLDASLYFGEAYKIVGGQLAILRQLKKAIEKL